MRPLMNEEVNDSYSRYLTLYTIDNKAIRNARDDFERYRSESVVVKGSFEDDEWVLNNELKDYRFRFVIDGRKYSAKAGKWSGLNAAKFKLCMKTFIVMRLGEVVLGHLCTVCKDILDIAYMDPDEVSYGRNGSHVLEFLGALPGDSESRDRVLESLDDDKNSQIWKKSKSRKLEEFSNYLRFDARLADFWRSADEQKKVYYFPVFFWWKLTSILPLRPTEFLLIPKKCIRSESDGYFIKVRRTRNKKNHEKKRYKVNDDYEICEYGIPEELYKEIQLYVKRTRKIRRDENITLLIPGKDAQTWYLSYQQMNYRLHKFLRQELMMDETAVNLGDTRHLAMINLMLSGGSPVICRELAGHEDIDISSNYYSNLSTIVESTVYEYCHSGDQRAVLDGKLFFPITLPEHKVRLSDGYCDYLPVERGDISECVKNFQGQMRLGECHDCRHFYPDRQGLRLSIRNERKEAVDMSGEFLMQMIEAVRKGNGQTESIQAAMARLCKAGNDYAGVLFRQYMEEM
ncbi:MAG: site-specific integrase [Butyrivibrio sp.]|nr:site-specific integrase [Butyrivibrio sp.]